MRNVSQTCTNIIEPGSDGHPRSLEDYRPYRATMQCGHVLFARVLDIDAKLGHRLGERCAGLEIHLLSIVGQDRHRQAAAGRRRRDWYDDETINTTGEAEGEDYIHSDRSHGTPLLVDTTDTKRFRFVVPSNVWSTHSFILRKSRVSRKRMTSTCDCYLRRA
jgi:hypothetical protein